MSSIQKMYLVNQDQLKGLKTEGDDVKIKKYNEAFLKKDAAERITEEQNWQNLSERLKPLLGKNVDSLQEKSLQFSAEKRPAALFILRLLDHFPNVIMNQNDLLIDGKAQGSSLIEIVNEIIRNNVVDMNSLILTLRGVKPETLSQPKFSTLSQPAARPPPPSSSSSSPIKTVPRDDAPPRGTPGSLKAKRNKLAAIASASAAASPPHTRSRAKDGIIGGDQRNLSRDFQWYGWTPNSKKKK